MSFQVKQNTKRDFTESQTLSLKRSSKCDLRGVVAGGYSEGQNTFNEAHNGHLLLWGEGLGTGWQTSVSERGGDG